MKKKIILISIFILFLISPLIASIWTNLNEKKSILKQDQEESTKFNI